MGGKTFGNLYYLRNLIYIQLSSHEVNPFHKFFSTTLRHWNRDFWAYGIYVIPSYVSCHALVHMCDTINIRMARKNPADYENDE
ncbi:ubiquinol-cytochrome c reductase ubiquinone-binding protein [Brevipalpus obovatus]|uniref:ubiquinol-cytochrome c reductase ubiquinone-binding protein n=1 Tax=Brevipalpus obovatus TaxID=246614 RepID=UPI003D9E22C3